MTDSNANNTYIKRFERNFRRGTLRYHLSSFWLGYLLEMKTHVQLLGSKGQTPEKKFVIFTSGRSGSTLLVDLLNSIPSIQCDGELLKRRVAFPNALVHKFEQQTTRPIYGFKLLSYQLLNVQTGIKDKQAFLDQLIKEQNYQLIHLSRNNKAKQALSIIYAFYRGQWHNKGGSKQKAVKRFELSPEVYLFFLKELEILEAFEQASVKDRAHLSLTYEKHLKQPEFYPKTMEMIADFLNIETVPVETKLRKVTPSKLSDMISNQEELVKAVRNSPYEEYAITLEQM